jgi:hypothetical protein
MPEIHLNDAPWEVTKWWHEPHPKEGGEGHDRPVIVDKNGCFVAEFGIGFGFEHAERVAHKLVALFNEDARKHKEG